MPKPYGSGSISGVRVFKITHTAQTARTTGIIWNAIVRPAYQLSREIDTAREMLKVAHVVNKASNPKRRYIQSQTQTTRTKKATARALRPAPSPKLPNPGDA